MKLEEIKVGDTVEKNRNREWDWGAQHLHPKTKQPMTGKVIEIYTREIFDIEVLWEDGHGYSYYYNEKKQDVVKVQPKLSITEII